MKHLTDYIRQLQAHGEICFTSEQALGALSVSQHALNISLSRARKKGTVATVARGFHIIVSPEYRILGCLPANYFIDFLMQYWEIDYYVCLLNAAECHGAAHQKPQVYQVMVSKRIKSIRCGKVAIDFIYKKDVVKMPIKNFEGPAGNYKIASPELIAMDLLIYPERVGGINRIATILEELADSLEVNKLLELAKVTKKLNWVQRLGFILEQLVGDEDDPKLLEIIFGLKEYLQQQSPRYIPLVTGSIEGRPKNKDWHIIVNAEVESDL